MVERERVVCVWCCVSESESLCVCVCVSEREFVVCVRRERSLVWWCERERVVCVCV